MTRKQLRDRVINEIGLQDIEDYDETALVDDLIFQGTVDLLARTRCTVRCVHLKTKANVSTYVLDKSILGLVDVEDGASQRLRRDETTPGFTLIRSDILRLNPTPDADGEVDVWAVMRPSRMLQDTDSPSSDQFGGIPDEYHDAIFLYACWHGSSYADDESGANGERYRALYEGQDTRSGKIQQIKMLVNKRGTARAPRRRIRTDAMTPVSSHRSFTG